MTTASEGRAPALVDTSVAIALVAADHEFHEATIRALAGRELGLAGHAYFEAYSVLTRLPPPARRAPTEVRAILEHNFPATQFLSPKRAAALARRLPTLA